MESTDSATMSQNDITILGRSKQLLSTNHTLSTGYTLLTEAIRELDFDKVVLLVSRGADVSQREAGGATPLLLAAQTNQTRIAQVLLSKGAYVNQGDSYDTPLTVAVRNRYTEMIECLVDHNAAIDAVSFKGTSPLFWAIKEEEIEILEILVRRGVPPNSRNAYGDLPLMAALKKGSSENIIQCLAENGARITANILAWVATNGSVELMRILLNYVDPGDMKVVNDSLLRIALRNRKFEIAKYLATFVLDISKSGLVDAIKSHDLEIVEFIYAKQYDLKPDSIDLAHGLNAALEVGSVAIAQFFFESGATLSSLGLKRTLFLLRFVRDMNYEMVELLLTNGGEVDKSLYGHTPLTRAVVAGDCYMIRQLLRHNADINLANKQNSTPLAIAARNLNSALMELLVRRGANLDADPAQGESLVEDGYEQAKMDVAKRDSVTDEEEAEKEEEERKKKMIEDRKRRKREARKRKHERRKQEREKLVGGISCCCV